MSRVQSEKEETINPYICGKQTQSFSKMATTTASLSINSPDISGDVIAISKTTQLKKAGVSTGLDQTTGVGKKITTATTQYTLFPQAKLHRQQGSQDLHQSRL